MLLLCTAIAALLHPSAAAAWTGVPSIPILSKGDANKGLGLFMDDRCKGTGAPGCVGTSGARFCTQYGPTKEFPGFPTCPTPTGQQAWQQPGKPVKAQPKTSWEQPPMQQRAPATISSTCSCPLPACHGGAPQCMSRSVPFRTGTMPPNGFKIAMLADTGGGLPFQANLRMLKQNRVDVLLHAGDMGYGEAAPAKWVQMVKSKLGQPMIGALGNHDMSDWSQMQSQQSIYELARELGTCDGQTGASMVCTLPGITVVSTAPGTLGSGHAAYIRSAFKAHPNPWKICIFHKLMKALQPGGKGDEAGYEVYEACKKQGAFVVTGHTHLYGRTKLLNSFSSQSIVNGDGSNVHMQPGHSFAMVVGTGGMGANRPNPHITSLPYWAKVAEGPGAVICTFGGLQATCEFKRASGEVLDSFRLSAAPSEGCGC